MTTARDAGRLGGDRRMGSPRVATWAALLVVAPWAVAATSTFAQSEPSTNPPASIELDKLKRSEPAAPAGDLFRSRSWEKPVRPSKAPPPPPAPPPQAPPLPYAYLGRLIEGDETTVFLSRQNRNYLARAGETLDGLYRVESIEESRMVLTYLPLGAQQVLPFTGGPVAAARAARPGTASPTAPPLALPEEED